MRLLVGLGNPDPQHIGTRHNAGFACIDAVAEAIGEVSWERFANGLLAKVRVGEGQHLLFKPMTYMNCSGEPLRKVLDYYNISTNDLCVVADDVYVAPGSVRLRQSGGDGGHNGWKSVLAHVDPDIFWRVRIGVGIYEQHPERRQHQPPLEDYVLQKLPVDDVKKVQAVIDSLVPNLVEWLGSGKIAGSS